ncbi:cardiolipin synthase [Flavobacterium sp. xlx-214]|uniref:cardiolipin synthase n=1 Tax=unclassified Flavobacterium TaxID=196869 RepID=UPI0013D466F0|nr:MULTISPECIES: cardiolipin synthase [unclassified Flavobacterium]MBA5793292.1 cardiolipin synthase [Flavobacterium sp. xlx-221]QMI84143.1 cardiolipin synthase [Flavobacterium sp. xlx-214]
MENLQIIWDFTKEWYWIPLTLVNVFAFITILIENGKPEKTIAWLMVIVFLPFIGVILYYFFGQKFQKEKHFKKLDNRYKAKIEERWHDLKHFIAKEIKRTETYDDHLNDVFEYLVYTKNAIPTSNNKAQLLINGEQKFPKLLEDLKNAQHHIHLEYYIFEEDVIGTQILNILVDKVKQGVEVRLIIDDFGSGALAKRQKHYQALGIQFEVFLPVRFSSLANSNYRNHRKIVVIDGLIGYVGGINISDKYSNPNKDHLFWRDTSIRIEGDATKILQMQFWLHWQSISNIAFNLNSKYVPPLNTAFKPLSITCAFSSPGDTPPYVMESMILSISAAQKSIQLCTPYFIPTESFKTALLIAVSKGVDISLMIPAKGDSAIVQAASLSFLKPFIQRGLKVYLYEKGFIHAKTICIDGLLSYVGTTNLDSRSFLINFELSAVILDETIAQQLTQQFQEDVLVSKLFTVETWKNEKWYYKGFASICRLLAPLL